MQFDADGPVEKWRASQIEFVESPDPDPRAAAGPGDEQLMVGHGAPGGGSRAARFAGVAVALVLGFALGRLPGNTSTASAPAGVSGQATVGICPPQHLCRVHELYDAALVRLVALALPDDRSVDVTATDDAQTFRRYQLTIVAVLQRGATVRITARDNSRHAASSPWLFSSRGEHTAPLSAERGLTDQRVDGVIAAIVLKRSTDLPARIGTADLVCGWCHEPDVQDLATASDRLIAHAASPMTAILAIAVDVIARSPALDGLVGLSPERCGCADHAAWTHQRRQPHYNQCLAGCDRSANSESRGKS